MSEKDKNTERYVRPSWDEYFLELVKTVGLRGTCDRGRSGCVIVKDNHILSTGYVGSPAGAKHCDDLGHEMQKVTREDGTESQHCIRTSHAEQNAISNAAKVGIALSDSTMYCNMTPCYSCAYSIINSGIKRVVCHKDYHASSRSKEIFKECGVVLEIIGGDMETYENM